jgi:hypothetical protein
MWLDAVGCRGHCGLVPIRTSAGFDVWASWNGIRYKFRKSKSSPGEINGARRAVMVADKGEKPRESVEVHEGGSKEA